LLLISHDRYFLDKLVSRVFELSDCSLREFEGNYSDYLQKRENENKAPVDEVEINKDMPKSSRKEQKKLEAEARQKISMMRKELSDKVSHLEQQIDKFEEEKSQIETLMADPDFYKNESEAATYGKRYQELQQEIPKALSEWESANIKLEELVESLKK